MEDVNEFDVYLEELINTIHRLKFDILFFEITGTIYTQEIKKQYGNYP